MGVLQAEGAVTPPVLVVRPGRGDTGLVLARSGAAGLDIIEAHRIALPSLTPQGAPSRATVAVIAGLVGELADPPAAARLVLPPGTTPLRRAEIELPIPRAAQAAHIADALRRAREALSDEACTAVLACRPTGFALDGAWGQGDPIGRRGSALTVEATALCAPVSLLAGFERALTSAGLALDGVIAPAEALVAACLPEGEGQAVHVGYGASLAVEARGGAVLRQAVVPIGRRHLEQDAAEAAGLEPEAAAAATTRALAGEAAGRAGAAVEVRLDELRTLLDEARTAAGFAAATVVLSGLPPRALGDEARPSPLAADADPLLLGAARLALGLGGEADQAALLAPNRRRSVFGWLKEHF